MYMAMTLNDNQGHLAMQAFLNASYRTVVRQLTVFLVNSSVQPLVLRM